MERIITIACLVLSAAGLAYLKTNQLEKMEADRLAAAEADSIAAAEAAMAEAEAAKFHFVIPQADLSVRSWRSYMRHWEVRGFRRVQLPCK